MVAVHRNTPCRCPPKISRSVKAGHNAHLGHIEREMPSPSQPYDDHAKTTFDEVTLCMYQFTLVRSFSIPSRNDNRPSTTPNITKFSPELSTNAPMAMQFKRKPQCAVWNPLSKPIHLFALSHVPYMGIFQERCGCGYPGWTSLNSHIPKDFWETVSALTPKRLARMVSHGHCLWG